MFRGAREGRVSSKQENSTQVMRAHARIPIKATGPFRAWVKTERGEAAQTRCTQEGC